MQYRLFVCALLYLPGMQGYAEEAGPRARPPQWPREVREVFIEDVRDKLVGERPDFSAKPQAVVVEKAPASAVKFDWAKLIDGDTLTSEIKRVVNQVAKATSRVGAFKSEGFRVCQRDFQMLAIWFGVVSEYDEEIRWQRDAAAMRDFLRMVAAKCEQGDDESFAAAQEASEVLAELMRGQIGELPAVLSEDAQEEDFELGSLMQRGKLADEERSEPALVGRKEFRKARYEVVHEAQVLAVLARAMGREDFGYSEDETYLDYARQLQEAAVEMSGAAREGDFQRVEQAAGRLKGACARCHEDYRG
jgi:hypothetical protein